MQRPGTGWPLGPHHHRPLLGRGWAGAKVTSGSSHHRKPKLQADVLCLTFLKRFYVVSEREEGKKEERDTSIGYLLHAPQLGDQACNPGLCPDRGSNQGPFALRDDAHQLSHAGQGFAQFLLNNHVYSPDCIPGTALGTVTDEKTEARESQQGAQGHR